MNGRQINMILKRLWEIEARIAEIRPLLEKENIDTIKASPVFNALGVPVEFLLDAMEKYTQTLIAGVNGLDK